MQFEKSIFSKKIKYFKLEMPFGNFYFCDKFFISELNEGVHFDWEMIKVVMTELIEIYGKNIKLAYISNRINSYSMDPQTWEKVDEKYNIIIASAIVTYNNITFMNASIEKRFAKISIKRCVFLEEAIEWVSNLKELN